MNENGEYRYSYEDYNRISYNPDGSSARGKNGIKVFAIIVIVLLVVTTAVLLGIIVSLRNSPLQSEVSVTTETSSQVSESSSMERPDEDEIKVPELNITSHAEEDT